MTVLEAVAQAESESVYRNAEREMRRKAKWALLCNERAEAARLMELAHHAGMEFVRNHIGPAPDRWERPGTVLVTHDDDVREGWR